MTRLTLTVLAACWALALVGATAQTPVKVRRTVPLTQMAYEMVQEAA